MIVPVVPDLAAFNSYVFKEIQGVNGIALSSSDPEHESIAAVLLEGLGLLRRASGGILH